jgi:hypothetical protein
MPRQIPLDNDSSEVSEVRRFAPDKDLMIVPRNTAEPASAECEPIWTEYIMGHAHIGWRSQNIPGVIAAIHTKLERRDNRVLSDRIQILANVCGLEWKLKTTLLNTPTNSYSTCLLALVMANAWPDRIVRMERYQEWGDSFMDENIGTSLKRLDRPVGRFPKSVLHYGPWFASGADLDFFALRSLLATEANIPDETGADG